MEPSSLIPVLAKKAINSESGTKVYNRIFNKLESCFNAVINQMEARKAFDEISDINENTKGEIFEKLYDRYLTFRILLSRDQDVYIDDIYHPIKLRRSGSRSGSSSLIDLEELRTKKIACIVGKAGQGKTTFIRKTFLHHLNSRSASFPIIITLRKIDWDNDSITPSKIISDEFSELGIKISETTCSFLLQLNRLYVLFDGFDEIPTKHRRKALSLIQKTNSEFNSRCLVTTRPGTEVHLFVLGIENFDLMDLNRADVESIISKHNFIGGMIKNNFLG